MLLFTREAGDRGSAGTRVAREFVCEPSIVCSSQVPTHPLLDYFRCSPELADIEVAPQVSRNEGYFTFDGVTCFGRVAGTEPSHTPDGPLPEVGRSSDSAADARAQLPLDVRDVVTNLRQELYAGNTKHHVLERVTASRASRTLYYLARPLLPVGIRRHLQRIRLTGWDRIPFPRWPVDTSVDDLMKAALAASARIRGLTRVPFIWFWPDGANACALMTHDIEGRRGAAFCSELMDIDEWYDIKAAFQIVPEGPGGNSPKLIEQIRNRGFEVNLHDLNHDGYLFENREAFLQRAAEINRYARELGCEGFRSGAMYRNQRWFDAFEFSYDMSVPNVAHLEPQRGGCCTVMPYFVGRVLELPLTTVQDYSLFHILDEHSIALWQTQCERILAHNGVITLIAHPDYLAEPRACAVYRDLLEYLNTLRTERNVLMTTPGEVNRWWRSRQEMQLVKGGDGNYRVEGPDSARARVAYARVHEGRVTYEFGSDEQQRLQLPARAGSSNYDGR
jgi:hypothetical protein